MDKPISDFFVASFPSTIGDPYFSGRGWSEIQLEVFSNHVIPEPAEYALVFGLFAIGFVIFMKYKVQQDGKRNQPQ